MIALYSNPLPPHGSNVMQPVKNETDFDIFDSCF